MVHGERFNGYSHLSGLVLALFAGAALLAGTLPAGDPAKLAAAGVFAFSVVVLYAASTLFHASQGQAKRRWERADHCAIYLLIAGTYTPFALVTLRGTIGWTLLSAIWLAAGVGIYRELRAGRAAAPSLRFYLGMGWLCVAAAAPLAARLHPIGVAWLVVGAVLYSAGTAFYRNPHGLRHAHGLWHLFVLAGTASHYVAVAGVVL